MKELIRKSLFLAMDNKFIVDKCLMIAEKIKNVAESKERIECDKDYYNNQLSSQQIAALKDSIVITFVGELILLKYQLDAGWNGSIYDYSPMFKYTSEIFKESDYSIGVLEGPVCNAPYSNGDFLDGADLKLNYPYEFLKNIKNAGISFVSVANNHMYDMGARGAFETLDNLEKVGVEYSGIFRNRVEREDIKILHIHGIKIAVLTYMDGQNKVVDDYFVDIQHRHESGLIVPSKNKYFKKLKMEVEKDFRRAKNKNPDLIIVIPHMGKLGALHTSDMQATWNKIFIENGADVILTAGSHSVQPIEWKKVGNRDCLIINSPGNYVNSRTSIDNDDASVIVKIYISKSMKNPIMCSIIPMYAHARMDKPFTPIPIYKINSDLSLRHDMSVYDYIRAKSIQKTITRTMLRQTYPIESAFYEYFIDASSKTYFDKNKELKELDLKLDINTLELFNRFFAQHNSILFIGDSITEGTKNGGFGWYEPLALTFCVTSNALSKGGWTSRELLQEIEFQYKFEKTHNLCVLAVGTNDIRYRNDNICAMDAASYCETIKELVDFIKKRNTNIITIIIAPWLSLDKDILCNCNLEEKHNLFTSYSNALKRLESDSIWVIDINTYILESIQHSETGLFYMDYINPTPRRGICLYSTLFLTALKKHKKFIAWEEKQ